jgi:hypothetical protein
VRATIRVYDEALLQELPIEGIERMTFFFVIKYWRKTAESPSDLIHTVASAR